jgi:Host cell surface-exposed lipoprotein
MVVETQPAPAETQPAPAAPVESVAQENARGTAEDYLSTQSFSRSGLIEQLKFEGFSTKDARYAVGAISVDWNKQAAKTAKDYLSTQSFSRSGLIEQLDYEGFTHAQAVYGVNQTGL